MPLFDYLEGEMQPIFNITRERNNHLFYKSYQNDKGVLQFHSQIELYFVDEGEMEAWVNGHYRLLSAGEMSVALSYDAHAYKTPTASRSSVLIIPPHVCEDFMHSISSKKATNPFITDKECVKKIKACYEEIKREGINRIEQLGYIYTILGIIMDRLFLESTTEPSDHSLSSSILFYVNENYKSGITPAQIAAHFGYSQSYISRYFKSCFNITLIKYLTIIRLKNAIMLMREQKHSTTYCSLESGFSSMRTFYRAFYTEFGCSPKEYIKREIEG